MGWLRSAEEVEELIEVMKKKNKGNYITQGVTFNKNSPRQMELLKYALMYASSFSGLGKEMLAERMDGISRPQAAISPTQQIEAPVEKRNVSNFL